tara:strand:+ start:1700 stop:1861 length:162 start_codon:yes stop_codon:yes gene_type:complete
MMQIKLTLTDKQMSDFIMALKKMPYDFAEPIIKAINMQIANAVIPADRRYPRA